MEHLCLAFLIFSRLFIAALWSPAGKGLTSSLLLVMFIAFLLLSHVVQMYPGSVVTVVLDCICFLVCAVFLTLLYSEVGGKELDTDVLFD